MPLQKPLGQSIRRQKEQVARLPAPPLTPGGNRGAAVGQTTRPNQGRLLVKFLGTMEREGRQQTVPAYLEQATVADGDGTPQSFFLTFRVGQRQAKQGGKRSLFSFF